MSAFKIGQKVSIARDAGEVLRIFYGEVVMCDFEDVTVLLSHAEEWAGVGKCSASDEYIIRPTVVFKDCDVCLCEEENEFSA